MGGHGGLNILPQKSWHVYNQDNRYKVAQDEEKAKEEEDAAREKAMQADREHRRQRLLQRAGVKGSSGDAETLAVAEVAVATIADSNLAVEAAPHHAITSVHAEAGASGALTTSAPPAALEHINFWKEDELKLKAAHPENEKQQRDDSKKRGGKEEFYTSDAKFDERFKLCYDMEGDKPWYARAPPSKKVLDVDDKSTLRSADTSTCHALPLLPTSYLTMTPRNALPPPPSSHLSTSVLPAPRGTQKSKQRSSRGKRSSKGRSRSDKDRHSLEASGGKPRREWEDGEAGQKVRGGNPRRESEDGDERKKVSGGKRRRESEDGDERKKVSGGKRRRESEHGDERKRGSHSRSRLTKKSGHGKERHGRKDKRGGKDRREGKERRRGGEPSKHKQLSSELLAAVAAAGIPLPASISASSLKDGRKSVAQLRAERVQREAAERERERRVMMGALIDEKNAKSDTAEAYNTGFGFSTGLKKRRFER
eukprot:gene20955-27808_t